MKKFFLIGTVFVSLIAVSAEEHEGIKIWNSLATLKSKQNPPAAVKELLGSDSRIPGFMVAIEVDDQGTSEFLLVPGAGMCIHVPPPPANQTVHVKMKNGRKVPFTWDPVWVSGDFSIKETKNKFNTAYYFLVGETVEPYEE